MISDCKDDNAVWARAVNDEKGEAIDEYAPCAL